MTLRAASGRRLCLNSCWEGKLVLKVVPGVVGCAKKCFAEARIATSSVDVLAAVSPALAVASALELVTGSWMPGRPWSG
ncbi:hypothetical protein HYQ46_007584 [Verticillium longisporum]|nr:hypothetical protein HYQ46_007584 [Verticillium longisporum]